MENALELLLLAFENVVRRKLVKLLQADHPGQFVDPLRGLGELCLPLRFVALQLSCLDLVVRLLGADRLQGFLELHKVRKMVRF